MSATVSLVAELEQLASNFSERGAGAPEVSLSSLAEKIAQSLGVRKDEVAILAVTNRGKQLRFMVPERLKNVGSIPLSSNSSLAARTARDSHPEIDNEFATARHVTVFEGLKLNSEPAEAIQKMLSAPILSDGKVIGVIQISRKGADRTSVGPDFTADELGNVLALCKPLGKLLQHFTAE